MEIVKTMKRSSNNACHEQFGFKVKKVRLQMIQKLTKEYSTSQDYFYRKTIDNLVGKKQGDRNSIMIIDLKFHDDRQHMEKYYKKDEISQELPELLEYYKYYSQDSICFNNKQFSFLAVYHQKKKAVLYQQLKRQLNISDSQQTITQMTKFKSPQNFDNVLSGLQITRNNDQSYLINDILKKLVNHYGPSRVKTINKLDCQFKFMNHNINMHKSKNSTNNIKDCQSGMNLQTMLESTNTSVRNNCFLKQKSSKNPTHRRFGSCQVPKSALVKQSFANNIIFKQKERQTPKEKQRKNKIRRRKSAEAISTFDSNTAILSIDCYKKQALKTQEAMQNKNMKSYPSQTNFKTKMEELRKKIRRDKENLNKKSNVYGSVTKKKTKKT